MEMRNLAATDFRNYARLAIDLPGGIVVFQGPNGSGKTNLLEAICVAATGDSPRARTTEELVRDGSEHAFVRGDFQGEEGGRRVEVGLARSGERQVKIDGVVRRRLDLVGVAPVALFWTEDIEVVRGEPGARRRLLDRELSSVSRSYFAHLVRYRRALEQRNKLLKLIRERRARPDALAPWDRALARHGARITHERRGLIRELAPEAGAAHERLANGGAALVMQYRPSVALPSAQSPGEGGKDDPAAVEDLDAAMLAALGRHQRADILSGTTNCGPHRDDLELLLGGRPMRAFGSQGEQRSAAIAIRLGLAAVVWRMTGEAPLVLLDDVLSELDESRRRGVFQACATYQQVIVTCCDREDIPGDVRRSSAVFGIADGAVV